MTKKEIIKLLKQYKYGESYTVVSDYLASEYWPYYLQLVMMNGFKPVNSKNYREIIKYIQDA